jgi:biotin operon repressor
VSNTVRRFNRPNTQFTQVSNDFMRAKIKVSAFRVACYVLSHDDSYVMTHARIGAAIGMSADTVATALKELEKDGYLIRQDVRSKEGYRAGTVLYISDVGFTDEERESLTGKSPDGENPRGDFRTHKKTNSTQEDQVKTPAADATAPNDGEEKATTAADIVAAYVDSYRLDKGGDPVTIRKVAGQAKTLLEAKADPSLLLLAAAEMGKGPFSDLSNQYARVQAASKVEAPTRSEDAAKAWILEHWTAGRVKPIEDRTGLTFPMPDIPDSVTVEQTPDFLRSARRAWITANKDAILTRLLGKVSA